MSQRLRRGSLVVWCAMTVATVTACSGSGEPTASSTADASGLIAEAVESRNLSADGNLGVAVTNTGDHPVDISHVTLTAPPFPASSVTPRGPLDAGRTVWYGVAQEDPDCAGLTEFADGAAPDDAYTVAVTVGDSTTTLPVERPDVYRRLGERACGVENVLAVVDVTFGPPSRPDAAGAGTAVDTTVEIRRRDAASGTVDIVGVRGTPQFAVTADGDPPLATLGPADDTASAPVAISALRCDAHILAEGKKNYTFGVFLSLDGAANALVEIPAPEDLHGALKHVCDVH